MPQKGAKGSHLAIFGLFLLITGMAGCTPFPRVAISQTATPASVSSDSPVLGGSQLAFTRKFGQPIMLQAVYAFRAHDGERVVLALGLLHLTTGQIRVRSVILQPLEKKEWDDATARSVYQPFFPPDAQPIGDDVSQDGTHHLYKSMLLANTFPPGAFMDAHGKQLAPGTFDVLCNTKLVTDTGGSYGCGLMIGEWPVT